MLQVRDQPHKPAGKGAGTALRATERFFQQLAGMLQSRSVTRLSESTERPTLITISSSVPQWTNFISNLVHGLPEHRQAEKLDRSRGVANQKSLSGGRLFVNVNGKRHRDGHNLAGGTLLGGRGDTSRGMLRNFIETTLALRHWQKIRTVDEATSARQSFLEQLSNRFLLKQAQQQQQRFTSVVQKFAGSKSSNSETLTRQIQYFGPPPDLSYARSESPQFQQLVTALRDFRPAQNEIKAPVPQLPSIAQLTSQVRHELERELRIERERRGL